MRRNNIPVGYVSIYELDLDMASKNIIIEKFDSANETWLDFVVNNRNGKISDNYTDMHIGPVANDNIYQTVRLFETGAYDAEYTVKKLKAEVLHDQWAFHTEKSLSYLHFVDSKEIR